MTLHNRGPSAGRGSVTMPSPESFRAIPVTYNGITFRSGLESDWAATFDTLGWYYEYEPAGVEFDDGTRYLCDFHLPAQNVWCEVKGPHNLGLTKAHRFYRALRTSSPAPLVVVLRPAGPGGFANWHNVTGQPLVDIFQCRSCDQWCFNIGGDNPAWLCRTCGMADGLIREFGDACRTYVPITRCESFRRDIENAFPGEGDAAIKTVFGDHGRLPLTRAPRGGRAA